MSIDDSCVHSRLYVDSLRYIISVIQITSIGEGKVLPSTGQARFRCTYTAVVTKPFKGEVVDGKVINVNKVGGYLSCFGVIEADPI